MIMTIGHSTREWSVFAAMLHDVGKLGSELDSSLEDEGHPSRGANLVASSPILAEAGEGIRSHRQFSLTSTQQSIDIPITENDIPNVFVSVVLIKGRSAAPAPAAVWPGRREAWRATRR